MAPFFDIYLQLVRQFPLLIGQDSHEPFGKMFNYVKNLMDGHKVEISSTEEGRTALNKLGSNKRMLENRKNGITPKRMKTKGYGLSAYSDSRKCSYNIAL